jgi:hypothetical protein
LWVSAETTEESIDIREKSERKIEIYIKGTS